MGQSYLDEIHEQPHVLSKIADGFDDNTIQRLVDLRARIKSGAFSKVILTGMGASLIGSYSSWLELSKALDIPVMLIDASELTQQIASIIDAQTLIIATSQSGESGEVARITRLEQQPGASISVTNGPGNSLANWANVALLSNAGPESTVSTKSYTGGLAVLKLLCAHLTGTDEAEARTDIAIAANAVRNFTAEMLARNEEIAEFLGSETPVCFIGRGHSYTSAQISALITLEAAKLHSSAFSGGGFRHGPVELLRDGFVSVFYFGDDAVTDINNALLHTILKHGGKSLVLCNGEHIPSMPESDKLKVVSFPAVAADAVPILEVIPTQTLQIPLSIARGFVPGDFLNASKITAVE